MADRTTIILGPSERAAAKKLAAAWDVTPSEAIRKALMRVAREELVEQRARKRRQRSAILEQLIAISKGRRVTSELRRLGEDRDTW
jgi:hypothetical protein